jgi:transketolase
MTQYSAASPGPRSRPDDDRRDPGRDDGRQGALERLARDTRRSILQCSKRANVGHIGSALSVADMLAALYGDVMNIPGPDDRDRDRFLLSKGHAALAQYCVLHETGRLSDAELESFCRDGSPLGTHPEHVQPWIDFSSGSLGQGLSMGVGAALAARMQNSPRRIFVLVSDAECNEGSLWEAVMFAAHHKLANLTAIVDLNGQQALGYTEDVLSMSPLAERWRAFGWHAEDVDGHDPDLLATRLERVNTDGPQVLIARTVFGKGVSFMEGQIDWHYLPMSDTEFECALAELPAVA